MTHKHLIVFFFIVIDLIFVLPSNGRTEDIIAVLSADLAPYREAYKGFQEAMGHPVPSYVLPSEDVEVSDQVAVIVAFGGKAASRRYPDDVILIYCLAPGTRIDTNRDSGSIIKVHMVPHPQKILSSLREIQPALKRLAVLWSTDAMQAYVKDLGQIAQSMEQIEVYTNRLDGPDGIPDHLRDLHESIDAVWLLPDPFLVNATSFSILKQFSWSNQVPFYSPTSGLVKKGATASVSSSFEEIGRTAAKATHQLFAGKEVPNEVYPEKVEITLSLHAIQTTGLDISDEVMKKAGSVFP